MQALPTICLPSSYCYLDVMGRTWMHFLACLLVTLALTTTCSGDDSTSSLSSFKSAPPLQRRVEPSEVHALPGTDLTLSLYIGRQIGRHAINVEYHGMAPELARFVEGLAVDQDNWNLPQFDFWPSTKYNLKLELRRTVPDREDPPINAALLTAISGVITDLATRWDRDNEFTASIADTQGAHFTMRVFSSKGLPSEQQSGESFDDGDLNIIFSTKREILRWSKRRDLVLFLGNTARSVGIACSAHPGSNRDIATSSTPLTQRTTATRSSSPTVVDPTTRAKRLPKLSLTLSQPASSGRPSRPSGSIA